jgi:hypothetical protein
VAERHLASRDTQDASLGTIEPANKAATAIARAMHLGNEIRHAGRGVLGPNGMRFVDWLLDAIDPLRCSAREPR